MKARWRHLASGWPADVGLVVGFVAVILADLVRYLRADGVPLGDIALIAMRTRDVSSDLPLVGVYSRYGWNHPGPWQLWFSRPLQAAFGDAGLYLASWLIGAVILATILWLLRRLAGRGIALVALVAFAAVANAGGETYLADPWNPTVAALPVALALVAAWAAGEGWRWGLAVAVAAASFAVGGHVGAAVPALVAVVLALVWSVLRVRDHSYGMRWIVVAAAVGMVAWLPAVLDHIVGDGNFGRMISFSLGDDGGARYGLSRGFGAAVRLIGWSGAWRTGAGQEVGLTGERTWDLSAADVLVAVALAVVAVAAFRSGTKTQRRLLVVAWLGWAGAVVSLAMLTRPAYPYLAAWSAPAAALVWTASLGPWVERVSEGRAAIDRRPLGWVAAAVAVVMALGIAWWPADRDPDPGRTQLDVARMAQAVDDARDGLPVLVCGSDPHLSAYVFALMNGLEQEGIPVRTADLDSYVVGNGRVHRPGEPTFAITLMRDPADLDTADVAGISPLVDDDELSPNERERADALVEALLGIIESRPPGFETDLLRVAVEDGDVRLLRTVAGASPDLSDELTALADLRPGARAVVLEGCR